MADPLSVSERIEQFVANGQKATRAAVRAGALAPAAAPGYRFAIGARVLDVRDGALGVVTASYGASSANARVYELTLADGSHAVRVESDLEPAPATVPPATSPRV